MFAIFSGHHNEYFMVSRYRAGMKSRSTTTLSMRGLCMAAALALPCGSGVAEVQDLRDLHLEIVPRTQAEAARIADVTAPPDDFSAPEPFEANPAGAATVRVRTDENAFSLPSANIGFEGELDFKVGNGLFRKLWVSSPSSMSAA